MHELSIAMSILELARQRTPAGTVLHTVSVRAGPMRGIEQHAMEFASYACTKGTDAGGSTIQVDSLPWRLHCPACRAEFESQELFKPCACGSQVTHPVGGDDLLLTSIEVEERPS
jgi:hydrogenase nickel incorporation protein HypA/HybF